MMMMDHQWAKSLRVEDRSRRGSKNPSFSSTLLDTIYRSIDEGVEGEEELVFYRETMKKKQSSTGTGTATTATTKNSFRGSSGRNSIFDCKVGEDRVDEDEMASLRRACMIEKWMEKKVSEKVVVRRKSAPDFDSKVLLMMNNADNHNNATTTTNPPPPMVFHSTSSSSDSSSGGGFSSSEAESVYGSRSRSSSFTSQQRPKPVRTSVSSSRSDRNYSSTNELPQFQQRSSSRSSSNVYDIRQSDRYSVNPQQKQSKEGGFHKTKSRALKIYGDLKKVKQPISPGGRLANFLNSIFTAGNPKKAKISSSSTTTTATSVRDHVEELISSGRKSKSAQASKCSSASSFSRSCLSKTPSSRGKSINGIKRSVRFYPVSVIVDEDSRPCGHKNLYEEEQQQQSRLMALDDELKLHVMEKNRRIEEAARDLLSNYREIKKNRDKCDIDMRDRDQHSYHLDEDEEDIEDEDEDEDDTASYSSSDLFELDNLASIGIERYREELPVYETTHLETNRAIANGLIL